MLYPQHSDRIVTTDYVASLRSMYTLQWTGTCPLAKVFLRVWDLEPYLVQCSQVLCGLGGVVE